MLTTDPHATPGAPALLLAVKVVPGARCDELAGRLGDRLKIRVASPPEGGRANKAVCALVAAAFGIKASSVEVARGASYAEKTLRLRGITLQTAARTLAEML